MLTTYACKCRSPAFYGPTIILPEVYTFTLVNTGKPALRGHLWDKENGLLRQVTS